ncbi:MAG: autotransporter assembly complex family protein [Pseudomonadota bacterium]
MTIDISYLPKHWLVIIFGLILASCNALDWPDDNAGSDGDDPAVVDGSAEGLEEQDQVPLLDYKVVFEGLSAGNTKEILEQISESRRLIDQPPSSLSRLRRRAEGDVPRLLQGLRARGHYRASVDVDIDQTTSPITITYRFDQGPAYRYQTIKVELDPQPKADLDLPPVRRFGIKAGERTRSLDIVNAEAMLLEALKDRGFALAEIGERDVVVDHDTQKMDVTFRFKIGPRVAFGTTTIVGNEEVEARFIRRLLEWKQGKRVTPERLRTTQLNLIETGLFNSVQVTLGDTPDADNRVPVRIEVKEAKHRSIEAGVRYRTDEGIGGSLGWEHRNLLGTGEQLGIELDGSELGWHLKGEAREPDFLRRRQALVIGSEIAIENTDAFRSRSIGASLGIERSVGKGMELAAGGKFRALRVDQDGDVDKFGLLSFPATYRWDHSNDLLNPSRGGRLSIENEPFVDVTGRDVAFNKTTIGYSRYVRLKRTNPQLILAARTRAGFLFGAERNNVPADERFFAGGGGSVRGFGFQLAGELDEGDDPIGGRSLFELAGEIRGQFTESLGAAVFVDSGTAFKSVAPDFDEPLRIGAGAGLRYFSPIGPIRLDVGVPINGRDNDDNFQIYVSIGQAF